jgi:hypothetical protein
VTEPLVRFPDWRKRLDDYLDSVDRKPFDWIKINCAFFAADAVEAQTGIDLAANFRGLVTDEQSAMKALADAGYSDVIAATVGTKRLPEISMGEQRIGDLAVVDDARFGPCLAVIGGSHLTCMALRGKGSLPLTKATRIFKVG